MSKLLPYLGLMFAIGTNAFGADPAKVRKVWNYIYNNRNAVEFSAGYGNFKGRSLTAQLVNEGVVNEKFKINIAAVASNKLERLIITQEFLDPIDNKAMAFAMSDTAVVNGPGFDGVIEDPYVIAIDNSKPAIKLKDSELIKSLVQLYERVIETLKIPGVN